MELLPALLCLDVTLSVVEDLVSINFWFEHIIDAYLDACARGVDWRAACATAEANSNKPRRVITQKGLKAKGLPYSRQHIRRKINPARFRRLFSSLTRGLALHEEPRAHPSHSQPEGADPVARVTYVAALIGDLRIS